ncbi:hypothetical protein PGSY75_0411800 [Plasmodium gaboni]|uniref:Uncharacterized protein n=1 Tax=Plasmodium gaboni TaxID=647221 RepID=A0A151LUI3_9APIC|nr:hypothetical protein PGSY75_0411800 [Plasmodium gaboni]KYO02823.1 hypothetical protein PGSY75_0411800 [Plasmodium gaboni]
MNTFRNNLNEEREKRMNKKKYTNQNNHFNNLGRNNKVNIKNIKTLYNIFSYVEKENTQENDNIILNEYQVNSHIKESSNIKQTKICSKTKYNYDQSYIENYDFYHTDNIIKYNNMQNVNMKENYSVHTLYNHHTYLHDNKNNEDYNIFNIHLQNEEIEKNKKKKKNYTTHCNIKDNLFNLEKTNIQNKIKEQENFHNLLDIQNIDDNKKKNNSNNNNNNSNSNNNNDGDGKINNAEDISLQTHTHKKQKESSFINGTNENLINWSNETNNIKSSNNTNDVYNICHINNVDNVSTNDNLNNSFDILLNLDFNYNEKNKHINKYNHSVNNNTTSENYTYSTFSSLEKKNEQVEQINHDIFSFNMLQNEKNIMQQNVIHHHDLHNSNNYNKINDNNIHTVSYNNINLINEDIFFTNNCNEIKNIINNENHSIHTNENINSTNHSDIINLYTDKHIPHKLTTQNEMYDLLNFEMNDQNICHNNTYTYQHHPNLKIERFQDNASISYEKEKDIILTQKKSNQINSDILHYNLKEWEDICKDKNYTKREYIFNVEMDTKNVNMDTKNVNMDSHNVEMASQNVEMASQNVEMASQIVEMANQNVEMANQNVEMANQNVEMASQHIEMANQNVHTFSDNLQMDKHNISIINDNVGISCDNVQLPIQKNDRVNDQFYENCDELFYENIENVDQNIYRKDFFFFNDYNNDHEIYCEKFSRSIYENSLRNEKEEKIKNDQLIELSDDIYSLKENYEGSDEGVLIHKNKIKNDHDHDDDTFSLDMNKNSSYIISKSNNVEEVEEKTNLSYDMKEYSIFEKNENFYDEKIDVPYDIQNNISSDCANLYSENNIMPQEKINVIYDNRNNIFMTGQYNNNMIHKNDDDIGIHCMDYFIEKKKQPQIINDNENNSFFEIIEEIENISKDIIGNNINDENNYVDFSKDIMNEIKEDDIEKGNISDHFKDLENEQIENIQMNSNTIINNNIITSDIMDTKKDTVNMYNKNKKMDDQNDDQINNPVDDQNDDRINNPVDDQNDDRINNPVDDQNDDRINNPVDYQNDDRTNNLVDDKTNDQMDEQMEHVQCVDFTTDNIQNVYTHISKNKKENNYNMLNYFEIENKKRKMKNEKQKEPFNLSIAYVTSNEYDLKCYDDIYNILMRKNYLDIFPIFEENKKYNFHYMNIKDFQIFLRKEKNIMKSGFNEMYDYNDYIHFFIEDIFHMNIKDFFFFNIYIDNMNKCITKKNILINNISNSHNFINDFYQKHEKVLTLDIFYKNISYSLYFLIFINLLTQLWEKLSFDIKQINPNKLLKSLIKYVNKKKIVQVLKCTYLYLYNIYEQLNKTCIDEKKKKKIIKIIKKSKSFKSIKKNIYKINNSCFHLLLFFLPLSVPPFKNKINIYEHLLTYFLKNINKMIFKYIKDDKKGSFFTNFEMHDLKKNNHHHHNNIEKKNYTHDTKKGVEQNNKNVQNNIYYNAKNMGNYNGIEKFCTRQDNDQNICTGQVNVQKICTSQVNAQKVCTDHEDENLNLSIEEEDISNFSVKISNRDPIEKVEDLSKEKNVEYETLLTNEEEIKCIEEKTGTFFINNSIEKELDRNMKYIVDNIIQNSSKNICLLKIKSLEELFLYCFEINKNDYMSINNLTNAIRYIKVNDKIEIMEKLFESYIKRNINFYNIFFKIIIPLVNRITNIFENLETLFTLYINYNINKKKKKLFYFYDPWLYGYDAFLSFIQLEDIKNVGENNKDLFYKKKKYIYINERKEYNKDESIQNVENDLYLDDMVIENIDDFLIYFRDLDKNFISKNIFDTLDNIYSIKNTSHLLSIIKNKQAKRKSKINTKEKEKIKEKIKRRQKINQGMNKLNMRIYYSHILNLCNNESYIKINTRALKYLFFNLYFN